MPKEAPAEALYVYNLEGETIRKKINLTNDFEQAGEKYRSLDKVDQEHLVDNLVADLMRIAELIQLRAIENLTRADAELGKLVTEGLNL